MIEVANPSSNQPSQILLPEPMRTFRMGSMSAPYVPPKYCEVLRFGLAKPVGQYSTLHVYRHGPRMKAPQRLNTEIPKINPPSLGNGDVRDAIFLKMNFHLHIPVGARKRRILDRSQVCPHIHAGKLAANIDYGQRNALIHAK